MNSLLLMEWNGKPPLHWDWESLMMVNATTENPKKSQATDWEIDGDRGFDSGSFNSSGGGSGSGSGGSGSDLDLASLSKSSKSASINSSSTGEVKAPNCSLETSDFISEDYNKSEVVKAKPSGTSAAPEASIGSGEPLLSLKLGKRTYFEDVYAGSTTKTSSIFATPPSSVTPPKRSKSSCRAINVPRCQVEGCNLDLSSAKDYHRKHRVCESHSKCPKVVVNGLERRFCQQCSRFHSLSEFDEKKRSCRRRLSDHNARRRKPQQESVQLNSSRLPSVLYDERQPMSFVFNRTPLVNSSTSSNLTCEGASSSRFTITKEYVVKPAKVGNIGGQQPVPGNELTNSMPVHHHSSNGLFPSKSKVATAEAINQGSYWITNSARLDETIISSNVDATQDLHRALSLLSTNNTWGSCDPKSGPLEQPLHKNHTSMPQSGSQVMPQGWPGASSEYWSTERQPTDSRVNNSAPHSDGSIYYHEFQLLRVPYETDFYSDQLN